MRGSARGSGLPRPRGDCGCPDRRWPGRGRSGPARSPSPIARSVGSRSRGRRVGGWRRRRRAGSGCRRRSTGSGAGWRRPGRSCSARASTDGSRRSTSLRPYVARRWLSAATRLVTISAPARGPRRRAARHATRPSRSPGSGRGLDQGPQLRVSAGQVGRVRPGHARVSAVEVAQHGPGECRAIGRAALVHRPMSSPTAAPAKATGARPSAAMRAAASPAHSSARLARLGDDTARRRRTRRTQCRRSRPSHPRHRCHPAWRRWRRGSDRPAFRPLPGPARGCRPAPARAERAAASPRRCPGRRRRCGTRRAPGRCRLSALCRHRRLVLVAEQQLVEHLVVGQQDVGRLVPDHVAVADQAVRRPPWCGPRRSPRCRGRPSPRASAGRR